MSIAVPSISWLNTPIDIDEQRFWKISKRVFITFVVLSVIVPILPVFELPREKREAVPPRVAKVLMEKRKLPPKPPLPAPAAQPKPTPEKELPKKQTDTPKPVVKKPPTPQKSVKERVSKVGLLAMRDELSSLRETPALKRITNPNQKISNAGSVSAIKEFKPKTQDVSKGSGGVDVSKLSRKTAETSLAQRELTKVESKLVSSGPEDSKGTSHNLTRSIEEIQLVIERHKNTFYMLYQRELRRNPTLKGKVLMSFSIDPNGQVLDCKVVESDLKSQKLLRKLVIKFKSIDFGEKDVETTQLLYPLEFFPS